MIYNINALPGRIYLGKHTENNAREVRVDCSPWLAQRPELTVSAWVTPPGGDAAYPAVVHMDGSVLVWPITSSDTAVAGSGMVEFLGTTEAGCRQLSATAWTLIKGSTTCTTCDPPDPAKPWVDQVLDAAARAEAAAERAEGGGGGSGGIAEETDPTVPEWAKQPEKPTYTAEEVCALPADTPIPAPYTLPTASADTLGGVKIGKGLQMDGDALSVITKEYELIKEITLEEDTTIIDISGVELTKLYALLYTTSGEASKSGYAYIHTKENMYYLAEQNIIGTTPKYVKTHAEINSGVLDIRNNAPLGQVTGTGSYNGTVVIGESVITRIRYGVNNSDVFPVGTKLKLWGVRANA